MNSTSTIKTFMVKTVAGARENIEITSQDTFTSFCEKVRSTFNFEKEQKLRIICSGTIITEDKFKNIPDKTTIICLATKPIDSQVSQTSTNTNATVPVTASVITPVTTATVSSQNVPLFPSDGTLYSFKQVQAYTIVFLNFISSNPQLRDAFLNNYGLLVTELAKNQQLEELMKNILSQSGQIMEAMEKGENIKVNINTNTNTMDKIELTAEDSKKIDQLIAMGFNPDQVVIAYLQSGKNIDKTLRSLTGQ